MSSRARLALTALFSLLLLGSAALTAAAARGLPCGRAAVVGLFGAALVHVALATRLTGGPDPSRDRRSAPRILLIVAALLAHLVLLLSPPPFSDDLFRYLLDGRASAQGLHPMAYAPDSPKIADLVASLPGAVNHPDLPTIYPPGAQGLFLVASLLGAAVLGWKLILLALVGFACLLASRPAAGDSLGAPLPLGLAIFAHPLTVVVVSGNGHVDSLAIPCAIALLAAVRRARPFGVAAAAGAAATVKLFPALWLAALPSPLSGRRRLLALATTAALLLAGYAPLAGIGEKATGSLRTYAASWTFNAGPHSLLTWLFAGALRWTGLPESIDFAPLRLGREILDLPRWYDGVPSWDGWVAREQLADQFARALLLAAFAVTASACVRRVSDPVRRAAWVTAAWLAALPVLHPWYLLWLLPLALASASQPLILFCASALIAFWAPGSRCDTGAWIDSPLIRLAQWAVPLLWLLLDRLRQPPQTPSTSSPTPLPGPRV